MQPGGALICAWSSLDTTTRGLITEYRLPRVVPTHPSTIWHLTATQAKVLSRTRVLPREDTGTQPLTRCRVGGVESLKLLAICHRMSVAITVTDTDERDGMLRFIPEDEIPARAL